MKVESKAFVTMLRLIAERKGITNYQISKESGISQTNIALYFNLTTMPSLEKFLLIAKAVGVNFFFEDKDSKTDLSEIFNEAMDKLSKRE